MTPFERLNAIIRELPEADPTDELVLAPALLKRKPFCAACIAIMCSNCAYFDECQGITEPDDPGYEEKWAAALKAQERYLQWVETDRKGTYTNSYRPYDETKD